MPVNPSHGSRCHHIISIFSHPLETNIPSLYRSYTDIMSTTVLSRLIVFTNSNRCYSLAGASCADNSASLGRSRSKRSNTDQPSVASLQCNWRHIHSGSLDIWASTSAASALVNLSGLPWNMLVVTKSGFHLLLPPMPPLGPLSPATGVK